MKRCINLAYEYLPTHLNQAIKAVLKRIKKKVKVPNLLKAFAKYREQASRLNVSTILGFPDEKFTEVFSTYWMFMQLAWVGVEAIVISGYRPVPGTEISDKLVADGHLKYNDDVFIDLLRSTSIIGGRSYNPNWNDRTLAALRIIGYLLFFGTAYVRRPWRLVRIFWNVSHNIQSTNWRKPLFSCWQIAK